MARDRLLLVCFWSPILFREQLGRNLGDPAVARIVDQRQNLVVVPQEDRLQQTRLVRAVAIAIALAHRAAEDVEGIERRAFSSPARTGDPDGTVAPLSLHIR